MFRTMKNGVGGLGFDRQACNKHGDVCSDAPNDKQLSVKIDDQRKAAQAVFVALANAEEAASAAAAASGALESALQKAEEHAGVSWWGWNSHKLFRPAAKKEPQGLYCSGYGLIFNSQLSSELTRQMNRPLLFAAESNQNIAMPCWESRAGSMSAFKMVRAG